MDGRTRRILAEPARNIGQGHGLRGIEHDRVSSPCLDELDTRHQSFCDLHCIGVDLMEGDGAERGDSRTAASAAAAIDVQGEEEIRTAWRGIKPHHSQPRHSTQCEPLQLNNQSTFSLYVARNVALSESLHCKNSR